MSKDSFFLGFPVEFKPGVMVYPPLLKEIIENRRYGIYSRILTYSQEEIEDIYVENEISKDTFPTPLEYMFQQSQEDKGYELICKEAFQFFLKTEVEFLYDQKMILIGNLEEVLKNISSINEIVVIMPEEFFDFQNLIRMASNIEQVEKPNPNEHPRIKAMKAKARLRDRVKAKQAAKDGLDLFTVMTSICCMGVGITPLNIGEMSYVAVNSILSQYQNKEKFQIDMDNLFAGADPKKIKPKYWIRKLEE